MTYAFHNTSRFPPAVLRTLIDWVLADRDAADAVRHIRVMNSSYAYSGLCASHGTITIRIGGPEHFPRAVKYPGRARAPEYTVADPIEAFVAVTAHEAEHARQFRRIAAWNNRHRFSPDVTGPKPKLSEIGAEHAALATL